MSNPTPSNPSASERAAVADAIKHDARHVLDRCKGRTLGWIEAADRVCTYVLSGDSPPSVTDASVAAEDGTMTKFDDILARAREIASEVDTWADFSNAMFSQHGGIVSTAFNTLEDRRAFLDSPQYAEINSLLKGLMEKFGVVAGAHPKRPPSQASERPAAGEKTVVTVGFASWKDDTFELIVRHDGEGDETTLKGKLEPGQLEAVHKILPTCVFIDAEFSYTAATPSEATGVRTGEGGKGEGCPTCAKLRKSIATAWGAWVGLIIDEYEDARSGPYRESLGEILDGLAAAISARSTGNTDTNKDVTP